MEQVTRADFDKYLISIYHPADFLPVKAKGSKFWDTDGKEYIDFAGGIAVNVMGHCSDEMVSALTEQANKLWHISNYMTTQPTIKLAKNLVEATFADKVFFCNSGGEANEAALKLARRYAYDNFGSEKNQIISFYNSFHGRTLFDVTVGGQAKYCEGFGPLPGMVEHIDFNDIEALRNLISKEKTCAVILEPIQGEGGVLPADKEFLKEVRALCSENDVVLIYDEVQTGFGRTGHLYAYQEYGIEPDILTSAKGLGAGIPIGAMLARENIAKSFVPGTHGTTFGGNPLACAVACKSFECVNRPEFLADVKVKEKIFKDKLTALNAKYDCFVDIRGLGLLIGAQLKDATKLMEFKAVCMQEGVFVLTAGNDVVRMVPALNISIEEIEEGFARVEKAAAKLFA